MQRPLASRAPQNSSGEAGRKAGSYGQAEGDIELRVYIAEIMLLGHEKSFYSKAKDFACARESGITWSFRRPK